MKKDKKTEIVKIGKFAAVGILNTGITFLVIYLLMNVFHLNYKIANFFGYFIGIINSFFWHKYWVFQSKNQNLKKETILYVIVLGVSYLLQYVCLVFMVEHLHLGKNISTLLAMGVYSCCNYVLNRLITFNKNTSKLK